MPKSILVIDDDPSIREYLTELLTDNGYAVRVAEDGGRAMALLEEAPADLITLDIEMPEMTGPWFSRTLAKDGKFAHIPTIVITGHQGLKYVIPKAVAALIKPFDRAELLRIIDQTIGH
jgi:CheY-like chemotaxis protein